MWKLIPSSELEILKERSEILKNENKKLWNDSFHQREEVCYHLPPSLSSNRSIAKKRMVWEAWCVSHYSMGGA
jgi:hypothetical protein